MDARNKLSRKVATAHESTPEYEAMFRNDRVVPHTWGNLASKLVEAGFVEPTIESVCAYLRIEPEDLRDPRLIIYNRVSADDFEYMVKKRSKKAYFLEHEHDYDSYLDYIKATVAGYEVIDAHEEVDALEAEAAQLEDLSDAQESEAKKSYVFGSGDFSPFNESRENANKADYLRSKIRALESGIAIPFSTFIEIVLTFDEADSPPLEVIIEILAEIIDDLNHGFGGLENVAIVNILIASEAIDEFIFGIKRSIKTASNKASDFYWQQISPIIFSESYSDHPHFSGMGEK